MPKFAYTITVVGSRGPQNIEEYHGVMEAEDYDHAWIILSNLGYAIRDLHPARREDMLLDRWQKMRRVLSGERPVSVREVEVRIIEPKKKRWLLWVLLLILGGLILWLILFSKDQIPVVRLPF